MTDIRVMTTEDIPFGMYLKEQSGWNQTEADWRRFLVLEPDGCFIAKVGGEPAGTVTTCVFGSVAWIAMVLVDERMRGQGLGKALMAHALAYLDGRGVRSIRLDATPMGRPLYEKLGFQADYQLARYHGVVVSSGEEKGLTPCGPDQLDAAAELDHGVTGTDRRKLLERLLADDDGESRVITGPNSLGGCLMARAGTHAWQIGPCIGEVGAANALLADALARFHGRQVYIDIPQVNLVATSAAVGVGLTVQRTLLRMTRGEKVSEDVTRLWASSGPEKG